MSMIREKHWAEGELQLVAARAHHSDGWGHRCGYVQLPEGHPWGRLNSEMAIEPRVDVHGGITFLGRLDWIEGVKDTGGKWVGFDCAHSGDFDYFRNIETLEEHPKRVPNKSLDYVVEECYKLLKGVLLVDERDPATEWDTDSWEFNRLIHSDEESE